MEDFRGTDLKMMSPSGYFDPYFALGTAKWKAATGGTATPITFTSGVVIIGGRIVSPDFHPDNCDLRCSVKD